MKGFGKAMIIAFGLALATGLAGAAMADDWKATKLRGSVFTQVGNDWLPLARGDVVSDDRVILTEANARVQFRRGNETIDLGPDTQIRILDRPGQTYTIVQEHFGEVSIEAEHRQVQHFAVQTKFLAAVVKGTHFTVIAGSGSAEVSVQRGQVQVRDVARGVMADITQGQSASVGISSMLEVSGSGILPQIVHFSGQSLDEDVVPGKPVDAGNGNGNAFGLSKSGTSNAGGNGNGKSANSSSGSNGNGNSSSSNAGGNGNGNSSTSNAGGNGNGNSGNSSSNAGGNGNGNSSGSSGSDTSSSPGKSGSAPGHNK